jgi:hypothetical protein
VGHIDAVVSEAVKRDDAHHKQLLVTVDVSLLLDLANQCSLHSYSLLVML